MGGLLLIALAYLVGSIPTGVLLARRAGVDVQTAGSGNIGATNVARTAGKKLGFLTLLGDSFKGIAPVLLARAADGSAVVVAAAAVAAIVGHAWSVFLGFRGGKGVATGFGVLLGLAPAASVGPLAVFACVFGATRIVSLASLSAAGSAPLILWVFGRPPSAVIAALVIALIIAWKHRENIERLRAGNEARFVAHR